MSCESENYDDYAYLPPKFEEPYRDLQLEVLSDTDATAARVTLIRTDGQGLLTRVQATGSSKREPCDHFDQETGDLIAVARALDNLAGKLRKKAQGRVNTAENTRVTRARAKAWHDLQADKLRVRRALEDQEYSPKEILVPALPVTTTQLQGMLTNFGKAFKRPDYEPDSTPQEEQ